MRRMAWLAVMVAVVLGSSGALVPTTGGVAAATPTPIQVYGAWHCSDDYCTWAKVRTVEEFDSKNNWLIDRDGTGPSTRPSVNLVVLSFVNPLRLLNGTTDTVTLGGVPRGMTQDIVDYFKDAGVRVMLSIGGITYTKDWNTALANPIALAQKAAAVAQDLGVGIEIDYEENRSPNLPGLDDFIREYRRIIPYDASGANHAARLTIDVGAGDRWLIGINRRATAEWIPQNLLDYANAMVPAKQPSTSTAIANWQEHVDGKPQYDPPIPALAPAKFTGSVYVAEGSRVRPECTSFASSLQRSTGTFVQTVPSKITGGTPGMLGWMFWAAEKPSTRGVGTQPPNTCEGGVGVGATTYEIPIPMPALRDR